MQPPNLAHPPAPSTFSEIKSFTLKWVPRALIAGVVGYYSLGIAYKFGLMALIDKLAISILAETVGTAGIGAMMPYFQWYAAWGVRMVAAVSGGVIYDLTERVVIKIVNYFGDKRGVSQTA